MVMNSPSLQNTSIEERHQLATDAARKASVVPFVLGAGSSFLPGAEKALATGTKSILRTGATEFASEAFEEGSTKLSANLAAQQYAPEVRAMQGVAGAAALGGILGGGTGLAVGAMTKQPGSLLQGSAQTETREGNPNADAINNAIDSNSTEISTNSGQQVTEIQQQQAQLQQAQADAKAQADAVASEQAQQQAAQKAQEAQQAFMEVAGTYGFTPNPTGTYNLGKTLIRTPVTWSQALSACIASESFCFSACTLRLCFFSPSLMNSPIALDASLPGTVRSRAALGKPATALPNSITASLAVVNSPRDLLIS